MMKWQSIEYFADPRWASWNLGVFVCIRCSGIHRGMGTHISRVKSVDLDAWTDEQLQSILRWGNARANKYWESKLAPGHVPSEAKIENFIRTKYESKRWVMDGPMPDPSTLSDGIDGEDDDVPLKIVQERARSTSGAGAAIKPPPRVKAEKKAKIQILRTWLDRESPSTALPSDDIISSSPLPRSDIHFNFASKRQSASYSPQDSDNPSTIVIDEEDPVTALAALLRATSPATSSSDETLELRHRPPMDPCLTSRPGSRPGHHQTA